MPSASASPASPERNFSEGVVLPDGRKVRVLGYEDGSIRLRLDGTPYTIAEAFLAGGTKDHAIVKLVPQTSAQTDEIARTCQICGLVAESVPGVRRHARSHLKKGGLTRGKKHVQFWVNAWLDEAHGTVHMASPRDQANFRASLRKDTYLGNKIVVLLEASDGDEDAVEIAGDEIVESS